MEQACGDFSGKAHLLLSTLQEGQEERGVGTGVQMRRGKSSDREKGSLPAAGAAFHQGRQAINKDKAG